MEEMKKTEEVFSVRRVQLTANGHTYWQWKVDGRINGMRYRKHFPNRDQAEGYKSEMEIKALNDANVVRTTTSHLAARRTWKIRLGGGFPKFFRRREAQL